MGLAARRPLLAGLAVLVLVLGGAGAALTLQTSAGTDTLVERDSGSWQATETQRERFGEDAIYVLVQGSLPRLVLTSDLNRLIGLEGCLAGNIPARVVPPGGRSGPCARLAASDAVKFVFGPGTFINEAVRQISDEVQKRMQTATTTAEKLAKEARTAALRTGKTPAEAAKLAQDVKDVSATKSMQQLAQLALQYNLTASLPTVNDPQFVSKLVFADVGKVGTPKQRFAYLFPTADSALVQVRLRAGLSEKQRDAAIALVRDAVAMPQWQPQNGGKYVVTGVPVLVADLTDAITGQLAVLLIAAFLVMALALGLVFRARMRLLPLAVALGATAITFGGFALAGQKLTMASIGVLPILVGLGVDYAIQLQARVFEEQEERRRGFADAARAAARVGVPTIAVAATATAAGFLALALSPVPMVRQFGFLLVAGIIVALLCALVLGTAVLVGVGDARRRPPALAARASAAFAAAWHGAGEILTANRAATWVRTRSVRGARAALRTAVGRPGRVLAIAVALAAVGWAVETQTGVESNLQKLVPQDIPAMQGLNALQDSTGVSGEVDVVLEGDAIASPAVITWMADYQERVLKRYGYSDARGCGKAELCPAFSLPSLFSGGAAGSQRQVDALLDAVPSYFSQGVLTPDRHAATLAFGLKVGGLDRQLEVLNGMREDLDPPAGVTARLAGLPVLAAEANGKLSSVGRRFLALLLGLVLVGGVLLVALRSFRRALLPLVPIVLATGWSALVLVVVRIPLNPMSVALGSLVIAIATEFSVLLSERYRRERLDGHGHADALRRTYRSTGLVVVASGVTAIAGFAVLMLSDIRMLRDFGAVTVVDLAVSLAGVLIVLPAVLTLAERRAVRSRPPARAAAPPAGEAAVPAGSPAP